MEQRTVRFVKVKNSNTFPIKDRYDGVPYTVNAGKTETLPAEAVAHIFGFWEGCDLDQMYHHIVQRHGWNTPKIGDEDARKRVDNLSFTPVSARLVMDTEDKTTVSTSMPVEIVDDGAVTEADSIPVRRGRGSLKASAAEALAVKESE